MPVQAPFPPLSSRGPRVWAVAIIEMERSVEPFRGPSHNGRQVGADLGPPSLPEGGPRSAPTHRPSAFGPQSSAFTLLELLAVIGVIAILTGIVIGVGRRASESGKVSRARAELAVLGAALESYRAAHGDYPRTAEPAQLLQALIGRRDPNLAAMRARACLETERFSLSADPYASEAAVLLDPWDQPYRYAYKAMPGWTNPSFVLASAGPDQTGTPTLLAGGFPDVAAPGNADNLYANR